MCQSSIGRVYDLLYLCAHVVKSQPEATTYVLLPEKRLGPGGDTGRPSAVR